jgi:MoaA/NifB/PqqE/SkfB family radical SAM enzyme
MNLRAWLGKLPISEEVLAKHRWTGDLLKLLGGYSLFPLPLSIGLMFTARCNLACSTCVNRQAENAAVLAHYREPELSVAEWMAIVKDISRSAFFKPNLHVRGGEPSIYEGYLDVMSYIKQQGSRCSYTTNGTFLSRDAADIVSIGVDSILVSIDGPEEIHDAIRGSGVFERAVDGIRSINEVKKVRGKDVPQIFLSCVMSGYNCGSFSHLIDIARDLGISYISFLHFYFPDSDIGAHNVDVNCLLEEMAKARDKAAVHNVAVSFLPCLSAAQTVTYYLRPSDQLGQTCISPWLRAVVMPNGKVVACRDHVFGDFRADGTTMRQVWNNRQFRAFRRDLVKIGVFADCGRCCRRQC